MNPEIEQLKNFMAIATYTGYALIVLVVAGLAWLLKRYFERQLENQSFTWLNNTQQHPRSFLAFCYLMQTGMGLMALTFFKYWLHYYQYELKPTLNQAIVFWLFCGLINTFLWSKVVQSDFSNKLLTWYQQHPEIRLMILSVALYLILVVPMQILDPTRPTLDLVWLQSLLYGSLGLAWFHTFARLLMKISYPTIDNFMAGIDHENNPIANNANTSFNQLPPWLQLVISLFLLLCFVLVQAMISKIL